MTISYWKGMGWFSHGRQTGVMRPEADIRCLDSTGGSYCGCASTPTSKEEALAAAGEIEMTEDPLHTVVPWREVTAGFPTVLRAMSNDSLGGVLNFKKKQKERWTLGEEKADQFIREHRAFLEPIIARRAWIPEWWYDAHRR